MPDDNVVDLRPSEPKEPMVWVCACGCVSFELLNDRTFRCTTCGDVTDGDEQSGVAGWGEDFKYEGEKIPFTNGIASDNAVNFARRAVLKKAEAGSSVGIFVLHENGQISAWSVAETEDQVSWVRQKLIECAELVAYGVKEFLNSKAK